MQKGAGKNNLRKYMSRGVSLFLSFVDRIRVGYEVAKHKRAIAIVGSGENVGLSRNEDGGSSLQRME